ncbi:Ubiquitin-conjugating enzyme E2 6 [Ciborinia camelliae]|nr:Ubiquitin-conjugating enzyme E2 6 [Ciborinia camelliae]
MASRAANKRLAREFKTISENPPPYIQAHPSDSNILEWHYILTGPPDTPYHDGQYWGTLLFPPNYPFAPPSIKMHTPSGRFQPSTRLCLSISDFHPKSFNPAWEVSTILIGLLSFMTSEEMTTGSVAGTEAERKWVASRTRWWNSTGGGSFKKEGAQKGNIKAGDGGAKFRSEWEVLDKENWKWMKEKNVDIVTGNEERKDAEGNEERKDAEGSGRDCSGIAMRRPGGSQAVVGAVVEGGREGRSWLSRYKYWVAAAVIFIYVLIARLLSGGKDL